MSVDHIGITHTQDAEAATLVSDWMILQCVGPDRARNTLVPGDITALIDMITEYGDRLIRKMQKEYDRDNFVESDGS